MNNLKTVMTTLMSYFTFKNRGPQSEHLGGLFGYGLANGSHKTDPFEDNTYISSSIILSFCTPAQIPKHTEINQYHLNTD